VLQHRKALVQHRHENVYLQRSWDKYGSTNFVFKLLEVCSKELCVYREQFWINTLDTYENGFNGRPKAESMSGIVWRPETLERRRLALIASPHTKGRKKTTAEIEKWRESIKKAYADGSTGKRISATLKKAYSEGRRVSWCKGKHDSRFAFWSGKTFSVEHRRKMSESSHRILTSSEQSRRAVLGWRTRQGY